MRKAILAQYKFVYQVNLMYVVTVILTAIGSILRHIQGDFASTKAELIAGFTVGLIAAIALYAWMTLPARLAKVDLVLFTSPLSDDEKREIHAISRKGLHACSEAL